MMKRIFVPKILFVIFVLCLLTVLPVAIAFAGSDFLDGELRVVALSPLRYL